MNATARKKSAFPAALEPTQFDDFETITPRQLAEALGVSVSTVYQGALANGGPPCIKVSNKRKRFRMVDVRAWMESLQKQRDG